MRVQAELKEVRFPKARMNGQLAEQMIQKVLPYDEQNSGWGIRFFAFALPFFYLVSRAICQSALVMVGREVKKRSWNQQDHAPRLMGKASYSHMHTLFVNKPISVAFI